MSSTPSSGGSSAPFSFNPETQHLKTAVASYSGVFNRQGSAVVPESSRIVVSLVTSNNKLGQLMTIPVNGKVATGGYDTLTFNTAVAPEVILSLRDGKQAITTKMFKTAALVASLRTSFEALNSDGRCEHSAFEGLHFKVGRDRSSGELTLDLSLKLVKHEERGRGSRLVSWLSEAARLTQANPVIVEVTNIDIEDDDSSPEGGGGAGGSPSGSKQGSPSGSKQGSPSGSKQASPSGSKQGSLHGSKENLAETFAGGSPQGGGSNGGSQTSSRYGSKENLAQTFAGGGTNDDDDDDNLLLGGGGSNGGSQTSSRYGSKENLAQTFAGGGTNDDDDDDNLLLGGGGSNGGSQTSSRYGSKENLAQTFAGGGTNDDDDDNLLLGGGGGSGLNFSFDSGPPAATPSPVRKFGGDQDARFKATQQLWEQRTQSSSASQTGSPQRSGAAASTANPFGSQDDISSLFSNSSSVDGAPPASGHRRSNSAGSSRALPVAEGDVPKDGDAASQGKGDGGSKVHVSDL